MTKLITIITITLFGAVAVGMESEKKRQAQEMSTAALDAHTATLNRALFAAIREQGLDSIGSLLERGAQINRPGQPDNVANPMTPLYYAASLGLTDRCFYLIERGADVQRGNCRDSTPLHQSAAHGLVDLSERLLYEGADVNARDKEGATPLHYAVTKGSARIAEFLLRNNADIHAQDAQGRSASHLLAFLENSMRVLLFWQVLIRNGANIHLPDSDGLTLLHTAAKNMHLCLSELLLAQGADPNVCDQGGATPLHYIAAEGKGHPSTFIINLLVESGARTDAKNQHGATPLHWAAAALRIENCVSLLACSSSLNATDNQGETPLSYATDNYNSLTSISPKVYALFELLLMKGAFIIPTIDPTDDPTHKRLITLFCLLRRKQVPREICYSVVMSTSALRNDCLSTLFSHKKILGVRCPLRTLQPHLKLLVCETLFDHTLSTLKESFKGDETFAPSTQLKLLLNGNKLYFDTIAEQIGVASAPNEQAFAVRLQS